MGPRPGGGGIGNAPGAAYPGRPDSHWGPPALHVLELPEIL